MSEKIKVLDTRQQPVQSIIDHLERLLEDAKEGVIRGFFYGCVEGNGSTTWGHAVDLEGGEELRLLKLLLHPAGEAEYMVRQRLRANHTLRSFDELEDDEDE